MSKFSVKKPLTIFVAVVIIIVLGIVSYTRMTPDLMPNIDLPYVLITTPYPGASPEEVEREVSKPMEQAMATLDDIDTVSSVSNENYSMLILQFADGSNLDTVTVDILQKINTVSGSWDDMVATPTILKINPNMLPVSIAAVDMEGMDTATLSEFVNDTLLNKLEGINGVASVSAEGLLEEQITVRLNPDKIAVVNAEVRRLVEEEINEKEEELLETREELEDGKRELEDAQNSLGSTDDLDLSSLGGDEDSSSSSTSSVDTSALADGRRALTEAELELQANLKEINGYIDAADAGIEQIDTMLGVIDGYNALVQGRDELVAGIALLKGIEAKVTASPPQPLTDDELGALVKLEILSEADFAAISGAGGVYTPAQQAIISGSLLVAIPALEKSLEPVELQIAMLEQQLAAQGMSTADLPALAASLPAQRAAAVEQRAGLVAIRTQLEEGTITLAQAQTEMQIKIDEGTFGALGAIGEGMLTGFEGMAGGLKGLAGMQMASALTQLESGLKQLDSGLEQLDDARKAALKQADLNNIITMSMVSQILVGQNFSMPAGTVEDADGQSLLVTVGDTINSYEELKNLVLFNLNMDGMETIMLADVADIGWVDNAEDIYANINGNSGVLLSFSKQSNYATATVSDSINAAFAELEAQYPGLTFTNLMDQGDYIYMVVWAVIQNLLFGAVLAVIVLFVFLKNIKPTVVTLVSIPISVLFAFILMYFSGVTLNMFSLSGLAVAVGMLVDNSVVVIENIYRLRAKGVSAIQAAVSGAHQVGGAIAASTLTTVAIFMPIVFVEGITRQLFTDFALTFAYALIASLVIALTVVPSMSARLLRTELKEQKQPVMDKVYRQYKKMLTWTLNHKAPVLGGVSLLLVASVALVLVRGFSFMPDMDMGQLTVSITMPEGSAREDTVALSDVAVDRYMGVEGVETVGAMISGGLLSGGGDDAVTMYVLLEDGATTKKVGEEIMALSQDLDAEISVSSSSGMDVTALGGSGVSVTLYGDDMDAMQAAAVVIGDMLAEVEGTTNIDNGIDDTSPAIRFVVDKDKAMEHGLTVAQVFMAINEALTTETTSTSITNADGETFDVLVTDGTAAELTPEYIKGYQLEVTDKDGEDILVPIGSIAEIQDTESMNSIRRTEGQRYMTISAEIEDGYNVTLVTQAAERHFADLELTGGMRIEFGGENETIMEAMEQLVLMLLLGVLLVYLIMVAQFQSLKSPFIVMFTIPLAFTGGFLALLITGNELSVISLIGFVMLVGIIVNNGIVLVDYINQLRAEGVTTREAVMEAGATRMRPILMTSITTIFGLFTMAIGVGTGTDIMQPIAVVCIGGLLYATLLTLFVVPAIYEMLNRKDFNAIDESELEIIED